MNILPRQITASCPAFISGSRLNLTERSVVGANDGGLPENTFGSTAAGDSMGYRSKVKVAEKYRVLGLIGAGSYGRVYKALGHPEHSRRGGVFAIKKFRTDREGERCAYTGISQSTIREISICSELNHVNVIELVEIILEDTSIFMIFEYADQDLLQIIRHYARQIGQPMLSSMIKSIMFQLINGCQYLHTSSVLHRDLKPANIMVTSSGLVKIGDFGLARLFKMPLHPIFEGDKVVVTIWYRAPELLLGSWRYNAAVDMWAVGCIFAELLSLWPIFTGEEVKADGKSIPFQRDQMQKIVDILGIPTSDQWPLVSSQPGFRYILSLHWPTPDTSYGQNPGDQSASSRSSSLILKKSDLGNWYHRIIQTNARQIALSKLESEPDYLRMLGSDGYDLLAGLLRYDPEKRLTAEKALGYRFLHPSEPSMNCFQGMKMELPPRKIIQDDKEMWPTSHSSRTKRRCASDEEKSVKKLRGL